MDRRAGGGRSGAQETGEEGPGQKGSGEEAGGEEGACQESGGQTEKRRLILSSPTRRIGARRIGQAARICTVAP